MSRARTRAVNPLDAVTRSQVGKKYRMKDLSPDRHTRFRAFSPKARDENLRQAPPELLS